MGLSLLLGNGLRVKVQFLTDTIPVDPSTVSLVVRSPSGTVSIQTYLSTGTIQKVGAGSYYADLAPHEAGEWHFEWRGTGTCMAVTADTFYIQPSAVES